MALTKISTGGVKDDAASQAKIADEAVDEARLQISNAGSNGQFLQKQSGNTGGLTWAAVPAAVGGSNGVTFNDSVKIKFGTDEEYEIYNDTSNLIIDQKADGLTTYIRSKQNGNITFDSSDTGNHVAAKFKWSNDSTPVSSAELYYGGVKKAETVTGGFTITGVCTATSFVGDGSTLTNLPAGGNSFEAVADGAIVANRPVYINTSTGKVKQPSETTSNLATPAAGQVTTHGNNDSREEGFCSIGGNYFWFGFKNGNSGDDMFGRLGTYSSDNDTFSLGTQSIVSGTTGGSEWITPVYDSTADRFMVVWRYGSGHTKNLSYIVGNRSSTSLSYGTQAEFQATTNANDHQHGASLRGAFDSDNRGCCWIWQRVGVYETWCKPAQMSTSGNTASLGSATTLLSSQSNIGGCDVVFDSNVNRYLAAYAFKTSGNEYKMTFRVGNPTSGTAISWGTEYTINHSSTQIEGPRMAFDPDSNLVLCIANDKTNNNLVQYPLRITGGSTNTVALADSNAPTIIESHGSGSYDIKYDTLADKMVLFYRNENNSSRPTAVLGTYSENYSGTNDYYTWGTATQLHTSAVGNAGDEFSANGDVTTQPLAILPAGGRAIGYWKQGYPGSQTTSVIKTTETTHNITGHYYVGFSDAAYSDGQTVTVKTEGNVVSGFSGLTPFTAVYGDTQGNITHSSSGAALSYQNLGHPISADKIHIKVQYQ